MNFDDDFPMMMERESGMPEHIPAVAVSFGMHPVKDGKASAAAGHDIYKDVEFVKIAVPGDKNAMFFQPADDKHRRRFPKTYAAFQDRETAPVVGAPIEQWAPISRGLALTLRAMHINTVEALAEVSDSHVDGIGSNGRQLREQAKAWLSEARDGAASARLAAEKTELENQLAAMQQQIMVLQAHHSAASSDTADAAAAARKPAKTQAKA